MKREILSKVQLRKGRKFNNLTVIEDKIRNPKDNRIMVRCLCDCGKETLVRRSDLISGHTKTCGCKINIKQPSKKKIVKKVTVGQRFGYLVVEKVLPKKVTDSSSRDWKMVKCKCDCGNEVIVRKNNLLSGNTTCCSCSCTTRKLLRRENWVGRRHGSLVVTNVVDEKNVKVKCDCGNTLTLSLAEFREKKNCGKNCPCKKEQKKEQKINKVKNYIGKKFEHLTIIGESENQKNTQRTLVKVRCDCGTVFDMSLTRFLAGMKKSCGCLKVDTIRKNSKKNRQYKGLTLEERIEKKKEIARSHIGEKYGYLTIIGDSPNQKSNDYILVRTKCDCGNITEKKLQDIRSGNVRKCSRECNVSYLQSLIGRRYGHLVIKEYLEEDKVKVKCDCGKEMVFPRKKVFGKVYCSKDCLIKKNKKKTT